jgi:hypothetical protein
MFFHLHMLFLDAVNTLAPSSSTLPTAAGVAVLMAFVMDCLKRLETFPKVTYYSTKLNAWIRLAAAGIGTLGISWVWSAAGEGHQLIISLPAWSVIGTGIFHWAVQYVVQHGWETLLSLSPSAKAAMVVQKAELSPAAKAAV